jgi:putative SOS response-associated peptidase YedK
MCGRVRLDTDWSEIVRIFEIDMTELDDWSPKYNIAPTHLVPVLTGPRGHRSARYMSWGFVPWFEKSPKPRSRPINAKAEGVVTSGMFKGAFARHRCIVPASGFYEWTTEPDGKQPWLFTRTDGLPLALAGIWDRWRPEGGPALDTFCVLTTAANADTSMVHDRMPVVLPDRAAMDLWTDADADEVLLARLLAPLPDGSLKRVAINRRMGSPAHDRPEDCAPVDPRGPLFG